MKNLSFKRFIPYLLLTACAGWIGVSTLTNRYSSSLSIPQKCIPKSEFIQRMTTSDSRRAYRVNISTDSLSNPENFNQRFFAIETDLSTTKARVNYFNLFYRRSLDEYCDLGTFELTGETLLTPYTTQ